MNTNDNERAADNILHCYETMIIITITKETEKERKTIQKKYVYHCIRFLLLLSILFTITIIGPEGGTRGRTRSPLRCCSRACGRRRS